MNKDKKEAGAAADSKAEKPAEPEGEEAPKKEGPKEDPNLAVVEKFGEPDYASIAPEGEFNLYKVGNY